MKFKDNIIYTDKCSVYITAPSIPAPLGFFPRIKGGEYVVADLIKFGGWV